MTSGGLPEAVQNPVQRRCTIRCSQWLSGMVQEKEEMHKPLRAKLVHLLSPVGNCLQAPKYP